MINLPLLRQALDYAQHGRSSTQSPRLGSRTDDGPSPRRSEPERGARRLAGGRCRRSASTSCLSQLELLRSPALRSVAGPNRAPLLWTASDPRCIRRGRSCAWRGRSSIRRRSSPRRGPSYAIARHGPVSISRRQGPQYKVGHESVDEVRNETSHVRLPWILLRWRSEARGRVGDFVFQNEHGESVSQAPAGTHARNALAQSSIDRGGRDADRVMHGETGGVVLRDRPGSQRLGRSAGNDVRRILVLGPDCPGPASRRLRFQVVEPPIDPIHDEGRDGSGNRAFQHAPGNLVSEIAFFAAEFTCIIHHGDLPLFQLPA